MEITNVTTQKATDVIIVGAGPAGTCAAYYLASTGIKVTLLDKASFPREKIAGDMISPGAIRELKNMKITSLSEFNKVDRAGIYLNGKKLMAGLFPEYPDLTSYSVIVPRIVLDGLTLDAAKNAGATVVEGFNVTDFQVDSNGVTVMGEQQNEKFTLKSRLLIGADGHNSVIAKKLRGTQWPENHKAVVARGYFENVTGAANQGGVYYNDDDFVGYSWIFPLDMNRANVGIGLLLDATPATKTPKELLMEHIKNDEGMKKRLEKAELKGDLKVSELNMYDSTMPLVSDRVMLSGEAAGLINGFNGEGTYFALLSGKWAAETAIKCIFKNNLSKEALSAYPERVDDELGYGLKVSNLMLSLVRNRSLSPVWMKTLEIIGDRSRKDPEYAKITGAILSGMVFPNQQVTYKILAGVIQEAATSTGFETLAEMLKNPETIPCNMLKMTHVGINVAKDAIENPVDFIEWGLGNAARMFELATEVSKKLIVQAKEEDGEA
jgi:geranylgeranyl reductase family protein